MSGKTAKILRKGAKKFKLPLFALKRSFKLLSAPGRAEFLAKARKELNV